MNNQMETNFELNLLPVISMLAVIIGFLLVTAVWLPLGTFDIKQAIGESSTDVSKIQESRIEITVLPNNEFVVVIEKEGQKINSVNINDDSKKLSKISQQLNVIKNKYPDMGRVFVAPHKNVKYQNVVVVLELLNQLELKEIGLLPTL